MRGATGGRYSSGGRYSRSSCKSSSSLDGNGGRKSRTGLGAEATGSSGMKKLGTAVLGGRVG